MSDFSVSATNLEEVKHLLNTLPDEYRKKVMVKIIRDAAKPMMDQAVQNAPKSRGSHKARGNVIPSGTLKKSIGWIDMKKTKYVTEIIGPRVKGAFRGYRGGWYGHFVEFGHETRRSKSGKFMKTHRGRNVTGFVAAKPFMEPAWDSKVGTVINRFERDAISIFNKYVSKMKSRG